ncbi:MAG: hypothetical protein ACLR8Y_08360 [Alistipes indistinctus]
MTVGTTGIPQALPAPYRKLALQGEKATLTLVERGGALPQLYIVPAPGTDSTRFAQSLLAALRATRPAVSGPGDRTCRNGFPRGHSRRSAHCIAATHRKSRFAIPRLPRTRLSPFWEVDQMLAKYSHADPSVRRIAATVTVHRTGNGS